MQREQFQSNLETELRVGLIDQKSKNLSEAARLADHYVAIRKADRPVLKGHDSSSKSHAFKPSHSVSQAVIGPVQGYRTPFRSTALLRLTVITSRQWPL